MYRSLIITGLISILLSSCSLPNIFGKDEVKDGPQALLPTKELILETKNKKIALTVEIADDEEEREKGLMYRTELDLGKGMIFVFGDEVPRAFWMKNTLIPLDIAYLNSNMKIVSIVEGMKPCQTAECPTYASGEPAMFALEMPAGFVRTYGVRVGDKIIEGS